MVEGWGEMTADEQAPLHHEIILCATPDGTVRVEVLFEGETFWLTQKKMAELFAVNLRTVNEHLKNIFATSELEESATIRKNRIVQIEGTRICRKPGLPADTHAHGRLG